MLDPLSDSPARLDLRTAAEIERSMNSACDQRAQSLAKFAGKALLAASGVLGLAVIGLKVLA